MYQYQPSLSCYDQYMLYMCLGFILFFVVLGIFLLYLLQSISLYKLARRENISYSGLAFIPVLNYYVIGKLTKGNFRIGDYKIKNPELLLPAGILLLNMFPLNDFGLFVAVCVTYFISAVALYHLYRKYRGDSALAYTLVSLLLPILTPVFFYGLLKSSNIDYSYCENPPVVEDEVPVDFTEDNIKQEDSPETMNDAVDQEENKNN